MIKIINTDKIYFYLITRTISRSNYGHILCRFQDTGKARYWSKVGLFILFNTTTRCEETAANTIRYDSVYLRCSKTLKYVLRNISWSINPTTKRFEDRVQTTKGTSWVVRHYPKANTAWLTAAILKIDMTSYFGGGWSGLDEIRQPDAEWHADYVKMVEIETGSRIPIWRTFVFRNRK